MSYKKVLEAHNISEEEVKKWAKEHYSQFASNMPLMISMFFNERGIDVQPEEIFPSIKARRYTLQKVKTIPNGVRCAIEVLVVKKVSEREYTACSECWSKVGEDNKCSKHGEIKPRVAKSAKFIAGDETGDVVVNFTPWTYPSIADSKIEGQTLKLAGIYKVDAVYGSEFSVLEIIDGSSISAADDSKSKVLEVEAAKIKKLLDDFEEISEPELKAYCKTNKLKSTPQQILDHLGLEIKDGKLTKP
jgi:hypothetical protein